MGELGAPLTPCLGGRGKGGCGGDFASDWIAKEFAFNVGVFALKTKIISLCYVLSDKKFANVNVTYKYDNNNKTFHAKVDVDGKLECQPNQTCGNKRVDGLPECRTINVKISDDSCADPPKTLELHVPPGKYPSITPRLLVFLCGAFREHRAEGRTLAGCPPNPVNSRDPFTPSPLPPAPPHPSSPEWFRRIPSDSPRRAMIHKNSSFSSTSCESLIHPCAYLSFF